MDYQEIYIKLGLAIATLIAFYFLVARHDEKDNNDD
jgi:hypothetical protein|tara:strand:+ start:1654 stop:1761 length:108 start_codon:yes stop_codon:yes gene_type:complete